MNALERAARLPAALVDAVNIFLTTNDAVIGATPKDVIWTHRKTTLYRYRSAKRTHTVPVLLVFALINRPDVFDLRPGHSFVQYLLEQGFDVYLLDWGVPDDEDADTGLEYYVCDALPWGMREVLRTSGADELTLLGWCMGGTLCALHAAIAGQASPVRNLVLLTTPVDTTGSLYGTWVGRPEFDVDFVADRWETVPGQSIDFANKLMKPVANFVTTNRRVVRNAVDGVDQRTSYQAMAKWVAENPPFPSRAFREWITWLYKEDRLVRGTLRLRGVRADLARIEQNLLVVTAGADHIVPPANTVPLLDLVSSADVTHFDRPGGHIGLMAGSKAKREIWPDLATWISTRSGR